MKILLIVLFAIPSILLAQGTWEKINSPVNVNLNKCIFIDSANGWLTGDSGKVLLTNDAGATWHLKNLPVSSNIINSDFHSVKIGWVLTWFNNDSTFGSDVYSTKDGGNNWNKLPLPYTDRYLNSIKFIDSLNGFIGGSNGFIAHTSNGGASWIQSSVDSFTTFFYVNEFSFYNDKYGYAYGGLMDVGGIIWRTSNGGLNWEGKFVSSEPIRGMHFFDSLNIFAIGGDAEYGVSKYYSKNGGTSWSGDNLSFLAIPYTVKFRTASEAWVPLGFVNSFLVSIDSGKTWSDRPVPEFLTIYDIDFPDSLHGYAVGLDGVIMKYVFNPTSIKDSKEYSFRVFQNYPNPFNPETIISFSLKQRDKISVIIYDILGNVIEKLSEEEYSSGYHELKFNAREFASGVYFYKVTGSDFSVIKKMILIK